MVLEMHSAELALHLANCSTQLCKLRSVDVAVIEGPIKCCFAVDQLFTSRNRFSFHGLIEILHSLPLLAAQLQLVGELQDMHWTRIPIQLGSQRHPHSSART